MTTEKFVYNGYEATVIRPEKPNGKWIWKTEFLYAFDAAEQALTERGYTRVYYAISDRYGSYKAVRLMRAFFDEIVQRYGLDRRAILFGFSRGGLYAFNFALFYPDLVRGVYLDAPVLDLRSWPPADSENQRQLFAEYSLDAGTLATFDDYPVDNLREFFAHKIPLLLVAGGADEVVPFAENGGKMVAFAKENGLPIEFYFKPDCGHHPHSLEDVTPICDWAERL